MDSSHTHHSVLLDEVLQGLKIRPDGIYFDGTFGRGGHARAILQRLGPSGRLLAMDKDPDAIAFARDEFGNDERFEIRQGSFAQMADMIATAGLTAKIDGVLLDLGVSSPQLDNAGRGFSFIKDGPLDMRMDSTAGISAAQWLADADEAQISEVIRDYGEERFHRRIARAIVEQREQDTLRTTLQLAALIERAVPVREQGKHPATRSFQAIRIYINRELDDLREGLEQAVDVLRNSGRLVVISFHSLEDRLVKRFIRKKVQGERLPLDLPVQYEQTGAVLKLVGKAVRAGKEELQRNIRARSAVLRVAEKITG